MLMMFTTHALERMFVREIKADDVLDVIERGEVIAEFLDRKPVPSRIILGFVNGRALHVICAENAIITCYWPDPAEWDAEFKRRTS